MSFLNKLYMNRIAETEKNLRFWEDYLDKLNNLDFSVYANNLKAPALVPIGSRIFFRGELKHTNEVTVSLGADYFTKCSLKQAEILKQHRIKVAQSNIGIYRNEKQYLENQMSYKQQLYENEGQEIIEVFTEEEDKAWREKHKQNVKKFIQGNKKHIKSNEEIKDEDLWNRLEELELREELENELQNISDHTEKTNEKPFIVKEEDIIIKDEKQVVYPQYSDNKEDCQLGTKAIEDTQSEKNEQIVVQEVPSKLDLLQQVIDRQNNLEQKLLDLKNRERSQSRSQQDLMSKLDEMEQLEELEDEIDRLDDILECEEVDQSENMTDSRMTNLKRSVLFADEDDSETLQVTFIHSDVEPCKLPYNTSNGISKPSDIYEAYSDLFIERTSILKKSKYKDSSELVVKSSKTNSISKEVQFKDQLDNIENKTIFIKDIVEKVQSDNKAQTAERPISLFKRKRQQKM